MKADSLGNFVLDMNMREVSVLKAGLHWASSLNVKTWRMEPGLCI